MVYTDNTLSNIHIKVLVIDSDCSRPYSRFILESPPSQSCFCWNGCRYASLFINDDFRLIFTWCCKWIMGTPSECRYLCSWKFCCDCLCVRSEEHTSELQSRFDLVCRLLLEKKNYIYHIYIGTFKYKSWLCIIR